MSHEQSILAADAAIVQRSTPSMQPPLPLPRVPINIRPGTMDDIPFMDSLQKLHTKQVGWMLTKPLTGNARARYVFDNSSSRGTFPIYVFEDKVSMKPINSIIPIGDAAGGCRA